MNCIPFAFVCFYFENVAVFAAAQLEPSVLQLTVVLGTFFFFFFFNGNCRRGEDHRRSSPAHSGATGITPSCCVLCLHRNAATLRSKPLTSVGERHRGGSVAAHTNAQRHTHTHTKKPHGPLCFAT